MIFEDYLTKLDMIVDAKNRKNPSVIDQCTAHSKTTFLRNIRVVFFQLTVSASYNF